MALKEYAERGPHMVAIFGHGWDAATKQFTTRMFRYTSANFPQDTFNECVRLLQSNLAQTVSEKEMQRKVA